MAATPVIATTPVATAPTVGPIPCSDDGCAIEASLPNLVLSNGTDNITGPGLYLSRSGFSTVGVDFTAYTFWLSTPSGSSCESFSTTCSLATPFFVPTRTGSIKAFYDEAQTPFVYNINPACSVSSGYDWNRLANPLAPLTTLHLSKSTVPTTHFSTSSQVPTVSAWSIARATPSSTFPPLSPAKSSTEAKNFMIGLVVAIVVAIVLIALSLVYFIRRRRQRKERAPSINQDIGKREGEDAQLYFQQKVELDDEQRRHEMEAVEIRYEMEGGNEVHEMAVEGSQEQGVRQELGGAEHARELDNSQ